MESKIDYVVKIPDVFLPAKIKKVVSINYKGADSDRCISPAEGGHSNDDDDGYDDGNIMSAQNLIGWPLFISYGVGHVFNDMIASMWFTYALVYYQDVILMNPSNSGTIMLVGQLTDAVATIAIGVISDNVDNRFTIRYGRRKTWHCLGSIFVFTSLPFVFSPPIIWGTDIADSCKLLYYSFFIIIFQIGWACVENSHMALVPDLTPLKSARTALMSIRYSFTVFSNIFVYIIAYFVLEHTGTQKETIGPTFTGKFQVIVVAIMIIGAITTIIFHIGVHEPLTNNHEDQELLITESESGGAGNSIWPMFKRLSLYQTTFIYMCSRITVNETSVFLANYLKKYLDIKGAGKYALLPLIMYLSSFGMSFFNKPLNMKIGRKCSYLFGVVMAVGAAVWCAIGKNEQTFKDYEIYGVTILAGIACSVILVTSQGLTTDFIGRKTHQSAFIFGLMSLTDKVSSGVVIKVVQSLYKEENIDYYRNIMIFIWTIPSSLAFVALMLLSLGGHSSKRTPKPNTSYETMKRQEALPIMVESVCYS